MARTDDLPSFFLPLTSLTMVLTRRQYKTISRWLPNEILIEVIRAVAKADQATLARVCKLFHGLATPVIYSVVELRKLTKIIGFCRCIVSNSSLSRFVRSLTLADYRVVEDAENSHSKLILRSLKTLPSLEHLSLLPRLLSHEDRNTFLLQCTFPRLVTCRFGVRDAWVDALASFLINHPLLTSLRLPGTPGCPPSLSIPLSNLQHFQGPASFVPQIDTNHLKSVNLFWWGSDQESEAEPIFVALQSMTRHNIPLECRIFWAQDWLPQIVESVSRNLPQVKLLRLQLCRIEEPAEKMAALKRCLPRLTNLAFLSMESMFIASELFSPFWEDESKDRKTVQDLGELCPTLNACCLNGQAWWKSGSSWEKCALKDFRALAGIEDVD
ncbi:hypothetical protein B0H16DRAFT_1884961 [Mycena metata]|uniref:F-box domain-containing protein n=1 Tax=Mycena metata TaxID=1033252 RepID=A0AAD7JAH4_9AGAR|nr:hypothetical protein B0H16DRAFT_1884961 [Mycena metata]